MYNINAPVINTKMDRQGREALVNSLKKIGVKRVFIATGDICYDKEKRERMLESLKEHCAYFKSLGFEAATWNWSFSVSGDSPFTKRVHFNGYKFPLSCCSTDKSFLEFAKEYIKDIASTGVDLILLDDDFRFGFNCCCQGHLDRIAELTGEKLSAEELIKKILSGGKNKYRDAFCKVNGDLLREYAHILREAVDEVNPDIRIGVCAVMSTWGIDGITIPEISKILAGKNRPFARLIGAPYWATEHYLKNRLLDTFDLMRMERSWCSDDMEVVAEGDTYPRPRHATPASYLELYDIAMRADGVLDGIMKYSLDYYAKPHYEQGYVNAQLKNEDIYRKVEEYFGGKEHCGVRVYESMDKFYTMNIPSHIEGSTDVIASFCSIAARTLSQNSIPITFYGDGVCSIAFGENVMYAPRDAFKRGIIIDAEAARRLEENGIDAGLKSVGKNVFVGEEYYVGFDDYTRGGFNAHLIETKEGAEIDSFIYFGEKKAPGSYFYENKDGDRFFVLACDAYFNDDSFYRSYYRSLQLERAVKKLSGKSLPAYSFGNPDLYVMAKEKGGKMAVGLWNCFADGIEKPVVTLDKEYEEIKFINCEGELSGNKVTLSAMEPYSFAGFEVK